MTLPLYPLIGAAIYAESPGPIFYKQRRAGMLKGLEVVDVRSDENLIFVRGSVPGARGAVLEIRKSKKVPRGAADGKR